MQASEQLINIAVVVIFLVGVFDAFRIYFRVFQRYGGSNNFLPSHLAATVISFLRFALYFLVAAVVSAVGNAG